MINENLESMLLSLLWDGATKYYEAGKYVEEAKNAGFVMDYPGGGIYVCLTLEGYKVALELVNLTN